MKAKPQAALVAEADKTHSSRIPVRPEAKFQVESDKVNRKTRLRASSGGLPRACARAPHFLAARWVSGQRVEAGHGADATGDSAPVKRHPWRNQLRAGEQKQRGSVLVISGPGLCCRRVGLPTRANLFPKQTRRAEQPPSVQASRSHDTPPHGQVAFCKHSTNSTRWPGDRHKHQYK